MDAVTGLPVASEIAYEYVIFTSLGYIIPTHGYPSKGILDHLPERATDVDRQVEIGAVEACLGSFVKMNVQVVAGEVCCVLFIDEEFRVVAGGCFERGAQRSLDVFPVIGVGTLVCGNTHIAITLPGILIPVAVMGGHTYHRTGTRTGVEVIGAACAGFAPGNCLIQFPESYRTGAELLEAGIGHEVLTTRYKAGEQGQSNGEQLPHTATSAKVGEGGASTFIMISKDTPCARERRFCIFDL
jgi:hypothetical protein